MGPRSGHSSWELGGPVVVVFVASPELMGELSGGDQPAMESLARLLFSARHGDIREALLDCDDHWSRLSPMELSFGAD